MEEERLYDVYALDEDIKILEEFIEAYRIAEEVLDGDVIDAIEHLIEAYRKVKEDYKNIVQVTQNADGISFPVTTEMAENLIKVADYNLKKIYISKSKIKEKIEQLKQELLVEE